VLATLSSTRTQHLVDGGTGTNEALNSGYHLAYLVGAGCVVAAIGVALTVLRPEAEAKAHAEAPDGGSAVDAACAEAA
ncbi:MAG: hypothetical protein QOG11_313, partial [Solirubrobacteraceae bacterium]|nr:hypothetical protein [Solirubrobacteraceae bacterium]